MARLTFDITTVTMGELAEAEQQSGKDYQTLMRTGMSRALLALFIHELRSSAQPRSWNELSNLRVLDESSWTSLSEQDGVSAKSSD